jgi:uncharacterized protein YcnI
VRAACLVTILLLSAPVVDAHVTVWPQESKAGAGERYTVRVPTEGKVTTTVVELEVPAGVQVSGVLVGGGFTYDLRREGDRIVAVTWKQDIKPGEYAEFVFFAVNPKAAGPVAWKVHQRYADGTSADWTGVEGDRRPASVTRMTPAPNTR